MNAALGCIVKLTVTDHGKGMIINMGEPIRILHVLGSLNLGGAESRIMDLYRNMDRQEIQFDFLVHSSQKEHFDEEIEALGGRVYRVPRFRVYNLFSYKKAIKNFFNTHHEFRAVHGHMTSTASIYLPIAKRAGIPITIGHARSAGVAGGLKGFMTRLIRYPLKYRADYCLACSEKAGEAVYGKRWVNKGKVEVIPNAIDAKKYVYDEKVRTELRDKMGLSDKYVIGHVGSFREAKNHTFLIKVFKQLYNKKNNAILLLIGEGALMESIKQQVSDEGLSEVVWFLGNKADVSPYYQIMDYLVFPSLFEGLPGSIVEAQTAGLRCLVSDTVTDEVGITELVEFYSLNRAAEEWAEHIMETCDYMRDSKIDDIKKAGFDVGEQTERYSKIYQKNVMLMVPMLHQGGFERVCVHTARLLKDRFNVCITIFSSQDMFYNVDGIELIDLNLGSRPSLPGKLLNILKRRKAVKRIKKEKNIHITYSFGPTVNLINAMSRVHDQIWTGIRDYIAIDDKWGMKFTCGRSDKVICCTQEMADDVNELFHPKSVECLYNPCDTEKIRNLAEKQDYLEYRLFIEENSPIIVSVSRADDKKGFWHQIKAFSLIKKEIPEAGLMIIGDGDFSEYKKLAEELGISSSVLFTGVQKNPFCYLKKSAVFIMTSKSEGFPNAMVEAMAVGLPIVTVNCKTGPAEILTEDYRKVKAQDKIYDCEYGIILPIMNPAKNLDADVIEKEEIILADTVVDLLNNSVKLKDLGKSAEMRSNDFSTNRYISLLSDMIEKA